MFAQFLTLHHVYLFLSNVIWLIDFQFFTNFLPTALGSVLQFAFTFFCIVPPSLSLSPVYSVCLSIYLWHIYQIVSPAAQWYHLKHGISSYHSSLRPFYCLPCIKKYIKNLHIFCCPYRLYRRAVSYSLRICRVAWGRILRKKEDCAMHSVRWGRMQAKAIWLLLFLKII